MHRFYLPPESQHGPTLRLTGREAHHARHVLRVRPGEQVQVLDGAGLVRGCRVQKEGRDQLLLEVLHEDRAAPLPCSITLAQAIPKGKLFESILQKATELGAARIVPLLTERTIARMDQEEGARKVEKWNQIVIEAIKQCGSPWLPLVAQPMTVAAFIAQSSEARPELALVGSLRPDARHPRTYFDAFAKTHHRKPHSVSVAIGPEGDFTDEELSILQTAAARPITLGPLVLRTETASVYCLSVINYEVQYGNSSAAASSECFQYQL